MTQRTVIRNGHLIDPCNQLDQQNWDLEIQDGKVTAFGPDLPKCDNEVDATGFFVVPGLIDCHAHVYEHATVLGVNPDETCLSRGAFF
jgi:dihydroorotase